MTKPFCEEASPDERAAHLHSAAHAIELAIAPKLIGFSVEVLASIDSTNSELMRRAREGYAAPVLLVAQSQTAGRGRLGRSWTSRGLNASGELPALTFSLGLPLQMRDWSGLSLAVGLSVASSLHPDIRLKWPNDLWWDDRKLAGILIETAGMADAVRYAVIGVGLNITPPDGSGLSTAPAWLQELWPQATAALALERVAESLIDTLLRFTQQGFAPLQTAFAARDALRGRAVSLSDGTTGQAQGVDAAGALLVHTAAGLKKITTAEVSVRPTP
jgi:BirA family transcriptional regulator, biotin operon repressor / biotin---[acetyl-CoA-carboxylase] ligase